ncbi:MAG: DUF167 domain-containing protein [Candidatus Doudnabacteria bacterium]|nr:DUF167 domain-containing protein [Candidatus Doudnabacteria bacterium]
MSRIIRVHVQTHAHEDRLEELDLDEYKIWTTAIPQKGGANEAVIEILAEHFNVAPSSIHIKSGNKSTHKLIEID